MKTATKKPTAKQQERIDAIMHLRSVLKPGDTVHCVLRHVSSSGMSRLIDLYKVQDGHMVYLSGYAATALDMKRDSKRQGIKIGGCGMDMGFALVCDLSRTLFPDGFKVEGRGRNGDMSGHDSDGGYALKHSWI